MSGALDVTKTQSPVEHSYSVYWSLIFLTAVK